jgi:Cu-Zn family superoxide dismutase
MDAKLWSKEHTSRDSAPRFEKGGDMRKAMIAFGVLIPVFAVNPAFAAAKAAAVAVIVPTEGNQAHGTVKFLEDQGKTVITVKLEGLAPGKHGFHIHEFGDCSSADGAASGGHFTVGKAEHGSPEDAKSHTGDLGNIEANDKGEAELTITDSKIKLEGPSSIVGRSVVVHKGLDDMKSQPAGNSGPRIGCGTIGMAKVG